MKSSNSNSSNQYSNISNFQLNDDVSDRNRDKHNKERTNDDQLKKISSANCHTANLKADEKVMNTNFV